MKYAIGLAFALLAMMLLGSCSLGTAVDYSFYVAEHGEYEFDDHCYGIDDEPRERLLITDCGGYLNVIASTLTLGLSRSSDETAGLYRNATQRYLDSRYDGCQINEVHDLGGRLFEIFYLCDS